MRVLVVAPYWSPDGGGLERYARTVARRLAGRGHDVRAVALGASARAFDDDGVHVDVLPWHARASNTPLRADLAWRLVAAARGVDVVHAHTPVPFAAEMAGLASALVDVPLVVTYHAGVLEGKGPTRLAAALDRATLERWTLRRAARLLAVSPHVAALALAGHGAKTALALPGVEAPHAWTPPPGRGRVLYVGPVDRAYAWKGLDVLLAALRELPGARLDVAGAGDRLEEMRGIAEAASLPVEFHGRVDDRRLAALYGGCDVCVLPSTSDAESFGMVLAEAQVHGRPVVAGGGGTRAAFRDGVTGYAVAPGDPFALAEALRALLGDRPRLLRMGAAAREFAASTFDWERTTDVTERALREASAGRAARGARSRAGSRDDAMAR